MLDGLRQEGCLKARFPRPEHGAWAGAVTVNTAGGVAAGDVLTSYVVAGPGTAATVAGQAAERFYRALPEAAPAQLRTELVVAPGAALEWLPQEAILFDGCAMDRRLEVELAASSWFLGVERLVFGRTARGEEVREARLRDLFRIRRGGRVVLHDVIRLDGPVASVLDAPASGNGARAIATLVHAAPGAADRLDALRAALSPWDAGAKSPWDAGASAWDGLLVARVVAMDGACLNAAVVAGLAVLREGRPLPRVWQC